MKRPTLTRIILALLVLGSAACARQDSAADREAEINRRVQQQLAVAQQTREKHEIAQRSAELAQRERELASREAFLARVAASVLEDAAPSGDEPGTAPADVSGLSEPLPSESYAANEPVYSDGYLTPNEPQLFDEPGFAEPIAPSITVINQSAAFITIDRRHRRPHHDGRHHPPTQVPAPRPMPPPATKRVAPVDFRPPPPPPPARLPVAGPRPNPPHVVTRPASRPVANKGIKTNPN